MEPSTSTDGGPDKLTSERIVLAPCRYGTMASNHTLTLPSHSLNMALEVCSVIFGHFGEPDVGPLVHGFDSFTFIIIPLSK